MAQMARLAHKVLHGHEDDRNRYSLRRKRSEKSCRELRKFDASGINGKEDFFLSMGLEMRRSSCDFGMSYDGGKKRRATASGVEIRECRVVILGARCRVCSKRFKCKTDVDAHVAMRHLACTATANDREEEGRYATVGTNACTKGEKLESASCTRGSVEEMHRRKSTKLRLTLKIGTEVVTRVAIKRKHLTTRTIDRTTQTEFSDDHGGATKNDEREGDYVLPADLPDLSDNVRGCRLTPLTSLTGTTDKENEYFDGNVRSKKRSQREERKLVSLPKESEIRHDDTGLNSLELGLATETHWLSINWAKDQSRSVRGTKIAPNKVAVQLQQGTPPACRATETNPNDEVQQVLRITRGWSENVTAEVNHESPNRSEREILVQDVIKDMKRMERCAPHLSGLGHWKAQEENIKEGDVCHNYRSNISANAQTTNVEKSGQRVSNVQGPTVTVQTLAYNNGQSHVSATLYEPGITRNGYFNIRLRDLSTYGINYCDDSSDINNNNVGKSLEAGGHFSTSRYGGRGENCARPTILIDLVNDNGEREQSRCCFSAANCQN